MMAKPFFYRIEAADFFTLANNFKSDKDLGKFIRQFSIDLITKTGTSDYAKQIIAEATEYIDKKKAAGKKGGEQKASSAKAVLGQCKDFDSSKTVARSSTEAVTETIIKPKEKICTSADMRLADFNLFWDTFAYKQGKGGAEKSWLKINDYSPELLCKILDAAKREASRRHLIVNCGGTPKWAQGWLTEKRWEDEPPEWERRGPVTFEEQKSINRKKAMVDFVMEGEADGKHERNESQIRLVDR